MGKPARKRCYAEAKATRKGELQAEFEAIRKKPLQISLKEHLGKLVDNAKIDPLEIAAVFALMPVVRTTIEATVTAAQLLVITEEAYWLFPWAQIYWGLTGSPFPQKQSLGKPEVALWALSFAVAFIIVRHAGTLMQLGSNGIQTLVGIIGGVA